MLNAVRVAFLVMALSSLSAGLARGIRVPLFARQTNRMCSACHTNSHYLELTEMGRTFKLNGYRLSKIDSLLGTIEENQPEGRREVLLNLASSLGFMLQTSYTATQKAQPGTQNGTALIPDQLSLFLGGRFSPKTGGFIQTTYDPQAGRLGIGNVDLRYADSVHVFSKTAVVGLSVNNNPTVQDLWNSTPAWAFPWAASPAAPIPARALIDGNLRQRVLGVTANTMWNRQVYGEFGAYRSAAAGQRAPLDATASGAIRGVAPYWRVALPWTRGGNYLMVGAYGMTADIYPTGVTGLTNRFTDVALDFMDQLKFGLRILAVHGTWIHEKQQWAPGRAANLSNTLDTYRMDAQVHFAHRFCLVLSPFATHGSTDAQLYPQALVSGSRTGAPSSNGILGEVDFDAWDNVRLQVQYVTYGRFNGSSQDYDGFGRNAADNNTLYVVAWVVF